MNKNIGILFSSLVLLSFSFVSCQKDREKHQDFSTDSAITSEEGTVAAEEKQSDLPLGVQALLEAYPDQVKGFENGDIIMADGSHILYDDGKEKNFSEMLDNSSVKDMFYVRYSIPEDKPEYLADAGRSRSEKLFKKMYGSSAAEASSNLVDVNWFGQRLPFTKVNGVADQLKKVAEELSNHPEFSKYMKSAGTYYWRTVRGANRQSAHSYGIAIDLGVDYSDYWLWKNPGASEEQKIQYFNRFPKEIAKIFEKYGFIWGGAWYHFDTMHFEYRPEILAYARLTSDQK